MLFDSAFDGSDPLCMPSIPPSSAAIRPHCIEYRPRSAEGEPILHYNSVSYRAMQLGAIEDVHNCLQRGLVFWLHCKPDRIIKDDHGVGIG
ncbi:hypothetical protein MKW98_011258 [Papaver atlanticum]|uniref:Uncharacterized protein n=1 Tax=Papaver atlanticum TaxID=357466 RepID=A0AAD4STR3_9MAGN|nr:hypothetical protein MKW98_011258 [Papaver atlanticum]